MASFAEYTKKKKKKKSAAGMSFTDYTKQTLGKDDIEAPLSERKKVTEDIAPVKTTTKTEEKSNKRTWFDKGAFEDGYQFGDVTRVILGTGADIGKNITSGIVGMGEKLVDTAAMLGAAQVRSDLSKNAQEQIMVNSILGRKTDGVTKKFDAIADDVEKSTTDFVKKDLYNEEKVAEKIIKYSPNYALRKMVGAEDEEEMSVLGEKSDALIQSAGQLAATAGLQSVGVPWWLTTGATTFGAESEAALNEGATYNEAVISAGISAGAEILTEKLTGGISFGGKSFIPDELLSKYLGRAISSKTARTLIKLGVDATGEGFEEVLSGVISAVGQKLTYDDDKDISAKELLFSEEALEQFVGGLILGGGSSGFKAVTSKGVDYATGLTNEEKSVVDKVYKDTIAEEEADGKKLTQKEKSKIYDKVLNDMEKGYISTDTIEEVLGGDTYKSYKDTLDNEEALQKEFDTLNQMKQGEMTGEQIDRRNELKEQLAELKETSNKDEMKTKLGDEVFSLVKDSKLAESYNEKTRRSQAFEADLSQYEEKYQGTVKKAIESGILNNTRRTHEMVDFVAKISADKGVLFDFTDNEKIKNTSYAVDGKQVNGFVNENGDVVLNINSAKSLNSTAGHEITHILEGTELYDTLANVITEYAKTKGDYQGRLEALNKLYENVYKGEDFDTKVKKELVADLVGDYIFTDKDFVRKLSTENRNVFQKIYDEIKYLCKVATAGSKEARELEKVKKTFAEVYGESGKAQKNTAENSGVKYSISKTQNMGWEEQINGLLKKQGQISRSDTLVVEKNTPAYLQSDTIENLPLAIPLSVVTKATKGKDISHSIKQEKLVDLQKGIRNADIVIKNPDRNSLVFVTNIEQDGYPVLVSFLQNAEFDGDKIHKATSIHLQIDVNSMLETLPDTATIYFKNKKEFNNTVGVTNKLRSLSANVEFIDEIVPQNSKDVKYSLSEADTEYMSAVEKGDTEAAQRLVDEAAKNNGYSIEAYHGTPNTDFTVFDKERLGKGNDQYGAGFYFASDKTGATHYGNRVINAALDIKNPIRITATSESGRNLIDADVELTSEQAYEVVKRHPDMYDEENSPLGDYFDSYWESGAEDWMIESLAEQYRDVGYLDSDLFRNYPNELHEALRDVVGYDGVEVTFESTGEKFYVAWFDNQMKSVEPITYDDNGNVIPLSQRFNADNNDIRYSLSEQGEAPKKQGNFNIYGKDVALAPTQEVAENVTPETVDDVAPLPSDVNAPITEEEANAQASESLETLTDEDAPPETEEYYYETPDTASLDKKTLKNIGKSLRETLSLTPQETKAVQEIVQEYSTSEFPSKEELFKNIKEQFGEKIWKVKNDELADVKRWIRTTKIKVTDREKADIGDYSSFRKANQSRVAFSKNGLPIDTYYQELCEQFPEFFSDDIDTTSDQLLRIVEIANLDIYNTESMPLDDETIQEAVDIITSEVNNYKEELNRTAAEDTAKENLEDIAPAKAEQILKGETVKANTTNEPVNTVEVRQAKKLRSLETELADNEQMRREAAQDFDKEIEQLTQEYVAKKDKNTKVANDIIRRVIRLQRMKQVVDADYEKRISDLNTRIEGIKQDVKTDREANILVEEPTTEKKKNKGWFARNFVDKQSVFETLSLKTKNREIQAKANFMRYSEGRAQNFIGKGTKDVEALNDVRKAVEKAGLTGQLYEYLYHKHNIDRMTLENRYDDVENKPVFGDFVTADISKKKVAELEKAFPALKNYAESIYNINKYLRNMLVEGGVISKETADLWDDMYPYYVPIRRVGENGLNINVALDTNRTGINAPVKRATGGNSDILPLFDTMAQRVIQTYKAVAKNRFGVELKNTLGTTIEKTEADMNEVIESFDNHEELLQEGKNGQAPTFTVFENGERVTFEITEEMYDALKPTNKELAYTNKILNGMSNFHRALLTDKNPVFMFKNAVKDAQDVLLNSQHPARTYANFPRAMGELLIGKGKYLDEYMENGGEQNTYFENQSNTFAKDKSTLRKVVGFPLDAIGAANNFVERIPRLAEYIASRNSGASVEVAMLDAARVTTNFAAGGDVTKFANRNGATFLNASVQGAMQQVRNLREAKANGLKGAFGLIAKVTLAGLPAMLLNHLLWEDDEEYEELSDYVKDNYYIVGKYGDGKFVRIPKGRASAVIQDAFEQIENALTGNDEVDFKNWWSLLWTNLAPNSPIDNNVLAPIMQVKTNKAWYGEDLVPTRLQDLPNAEQFDESTDAISKWLGEKINYSPMKINYLLNQYSGGVGDVFLPMLTPEAESGDNSLGGNFIAPLKDAFTTDGTMNNQNVSDFYDTVDKLTKNANSSKATDKDILMSKYMNSVNSELGKLYGEKREIQNDSDLTDAEKYSQVKDIQARINSLAREGLASYNDVSIDGIYATVGDKHYRNEEGTWTKISDKQYERQQQVTSELGITPNEYWNETDISYIPLKDGEYEYAYENPGKYGISKVVGDYDTFKQYTSDLNDIRADKDASGKTISGSAKEKKLEYINNLDLDYGQRIILYRSLYSSKEDKATYNSAIVDYLDSREDISWEEMKAILEELEFTVYDDGTIEW